MEESKFGFVDEEDRREKHVGFLVPDQLEDDVKPLSRIRIAPAAERLPAFFTGFPEVSLACESRVFAGHAAAQQRSLDCCPTMILQCNPASGDCQFWSLAQSLNSYKGARVDDLRSRLGLFHLELGKLVANDLRKLAYRAFLVAHADLDVHLERWKQCAKDPSLKGSYDHARFLAGKRVDTLTPGDRQQLFDILMRPQETWGDETSLIILERLLAVRVDVVFRGVLQVRDPGHDEEPMVFVAMHLAAQHYESIGVRHPDTHIVSSAWAKHELPSEIIGMHRQFCTRSTKPWVRMSEDWLASSGRDLVPTESAVPDDLVHHVLTHCMQEPSARVVAVAARSNDCKSGAFSFAKPLDLDATAGLGISQRMVTADGGWLDASFPHRTCTILQCGISLAENSMMFGRAPKSQRTDIRSTSTRMAKVLEGAAPIHLF